jgi:hypothetical protein
MSQSPQYRWWRMPLDYPGLGTAFWLLILVVFAFFLAYAYICNETVFFIGGIVLIPIWVILFIVVPAGFFVIVLRRLLRRNYGAAAAFVAAPVLGLVGFSLLKDGFERLWVLTYEPQIEAAEKAGEGVHTDTVEINVGPPVTAKFLIPQMMWSRDMILYSDDKNNPLITSTDKGCDQSIRSLGGHFYRRSGDC